MEKSTAIIIKTTGITGTLGLLIFSPSIADVTVIAGVITPSANKVLPPIMVKIIMIGYFFFKRAKRAKIPPSPWLSARKVIITYLTVV